MNHASGAGSIAQSVVQCDKSMLQLLPPPLLTTATTPIMALTQQYIPTTKQLKHTHTHKKKITHTQYKQIP